MWCIVSILVCHKKYTKVSVSYEFTPVQVPLDHLCPPQAHQTASSTSVSRPPALTDRNPGMTTSSSSNDEAEKDKPNVTISSSSGEQWVKPRKIKSKRYVKRSAKVDQPTVDSTDEQEAEQAIKQRRKRKFVKRSNPVPLTTRSSEDEVASDDGEIFISPECPTTNNLFTEEQRIKSRAAPLLTERRTKMVFGRVNPVPPLSSSDEEDEVAISGDVHISSELQTTNIQGVSFNWSYPKNHKFFSVSKMSRTFKLVPP